MNLAPVLAVLSRRLGLDPASLGVAAVRAAVVPRMASQSPAEYALRLDGDPAALAALAEDVANPETWFFRGGELFAHIAALARPVTRLRPFRVLSLPCSTGEEPYSLGMACAEAGLGDAAVRILGVDLSARHLTRARRGLYTPLSFRQTPDEMRARYFTPLGPAWEVNAEIRAYAEFRQGNLLEPGLLLLERPFDLVFCRNLFIYLTPEARRRGLEVLARLTRPDGHLCTGYAEPVPHGDARFEQTGADGLFLFRRTGANA